MKPFVGREGGEGTRELEKKLVVSRLYHPILYCDWGREKNRTNVFLLFPPPPFMPPAGQFGSDWPDEGGEKIHFLIDCLPPFPPFPAKKNRGSRFFPPRDDHWTLGSWCLIKPPSKAVIQVLENFRGGAGAFSSPRY